ncbi:MAG TPA: IS110 family transposase [Herpetosiphonaceae bacterium]|nr:IS110 family transposase [Herpetosiphonaceae bacterium]
MEVVYPRCCGLDVHKKVVVACLLTPGPDGLPSKTIRTFGTMTADLLALADWLTAAGCTHVAMESTGVYWKPIWNLLEQRFHLLLVNARHIKAVPGRKSDVRDSEWIADLLQHGLLRGSFVPDRAQRELRELTRYRMALVRERTAEANRLQKTLEGANIKLAAVATDILGLSGRQMLEALVAGTLDPSEMADLAKGLLRKKIPQLEQALVGQVGTHQRFLIRRHLVQIDGLDAAIAEVSAAIADQLRPCEDVIVRLDTIPGIGRYVAEALIAEVGTDMSRFPSAQHLASWAGMCPGNHESAGKRYSGKTRKGSPWLRALLVQAAHAAARRQDTYLAAQYRRLAARRGKKRAAVAVGHTILVIVYQLLTDRTVYEDLGARYFDERDREAVGRRLVRRLEQLGYTVALAPAQAA